MRPDSAKLLQPSRRAKPRQQVAAVCYRIRKRGIEFLLVQTRNGRWIFPKGGAESGLTHAQSAALEAFEEAGVHGRIETTAFARYFRRKSDSGANGGNELDEGHAVIAYLCEVSRLERSQEADRKPTWFSAERAKQRLREKRSPEFGAELGRVVDRALMRIHRLHSVIHETPHSMHREALRKVRFEALEAGHLHDDLAGAALARHFLHQRRDPDSAMAIDAELPPYLRRILRVGATPSVGRPILRLSAGAPPSAEIPRNITAIDRRSGVGVAYKDRGQGKGTPSYRAVTRTSQTEMGNNGPSPRKG
jgi:8-oxo-dGTP pyrophosphatase MutT (NUDIX family)